MNASLTASHATSVRPSKAGSSSRLIQRPGATSQLKASVIRPRGLSLARPLQTPTPQAYFKAVQRLAPAAKGPTAGEMYYICDTCGYLYASNKMKMDDPSVPFERLPKSYTCPSCDAPKSAFTAKAKADVDRTFQLSGLAIALAWGAAVFYSTSS
eukprot:CAMPEP_0197856936 /NCGR_PEP_ID=MMETSP1438-20131217/29508_1 /TAXON_ID=1461541 /ORGANISM="Pterosperma sp., Strain CCMP1384" /LENGTH=154 /DNA_ID=CAMNT_0043472577 /DNA_START=17 /DNA_END=481 /DNA_ORIENTATION=-